MIEFKTKTGKVILSLQEIAPQNLPSAGDLKFGLEISSFKLQFKNHSFWVTNDAWLKFTIAARKVIDARKGIAALKGMSPGSCRLVLEVKSHPNIELWVNIDELQAARNPHPRTAAFLEDELDQEWLQSLKVNLKENLANQRMEHTR